MHENCPSPPPPYTYIYCCSHHEARLLFYYTLHLLVFCQVKAEFRHSFHLPVLHILYYLDFRAKVDWKWRLVL